MEYITQETRNEEYSIQAFSYEGGIDLIEVETSIGIGNLERTIEEE